MSMFCYQCQETAKGQGCTKKGVCGKTDEVANLQDLLIYTLRGTALYAEKAREDGIEVSGVAAHIAEGLFTTVTNVNFDPADIKEKIKETLSIRDELKGMVSQKESDGYNNLHGSATWTGDESSFAERGAEVGVLSTENEDIRSLRELLMNGLKGIAAYAHHAKVLGKEDKSINDFLVEGLASTTKDLSQDQMVGLVLKA